MADRIDYTGAPQIGPKVDPGGGVNINVPADAFGASLFDAAYGFGQTMQQAALKKQELVNNLDHDSRALDTSKKFSDAWADYGQLEGDAAIKGLPAYQQRLKDIYNEAVQNAPNDAVRKQLAQTMFRDADRYMSHGANYADTQLRHWHNKVHEDALENTINQAVLNRKQSLDVLEGIIEHGPAGVGGTNSVRERVLHKLAPNADLEAPENKNAIEGEVSRFRGEAVRRVVDTLAKEGDIKGANAVFEKFKDRMDGKSVDMVSGFMRPLLREQWVNDTANDLRPIPNPGGYNPTIAAKAFREGLATVPSRANAQALGLTPPTSNAPLRYRGPQLPADAELAIDRAARETGVDPNILKTFANIESSGRRGEQTGSYKGLFQLSNAEFKTHGRGDIFNANDNALAAAKKIKADSASFRLATGRDATPFDLYMIHQQGIAGAPAHVKNPNGIAWQNVKPFYSDSEAHKHGFANGEAMAKAAIWGNVPTDQRAKFPGGVESLTSGQFIEMWRGKFARLSGGAAPAAGAQPAPQPQAQPESPYLTTGAARQQRRASNLEIAEQKSGGDPEKRNALYAELNKRDVMIQNSVADRHGQIEYGIKMLDAMAQKGIPDISLEKAGMSESFVREAFPANKQWQAEHLIEGVKYKAQVANELHSLRFASQADVNSYFAESQSGSGVDSFLEHHRKKEGTTGAFAMGADPDAVGADALHRFDLHEQKQALSRQWYERRQKILDENPAQWTAMEPGVAAKLQALKEAEQTKDPAKVAKTFDEYAVATVARQRQMGIKDDKIHVLTAEIAKNWSDHLMQSNDPKGEMDRMAKLHGQQWNQIFHDMSTIGGLPVKMEMVQYLPDYDARVLGLMVKQEAAKEKEGEGKKDHRTYDDMIVPTPDGHPGKRAIDTSISQNPAMEDLKESLARRGINMVTQGAEVQDAVRLLAYGRAIGIGGRGREDHGSAAKGAVEAFVSGHEFTPDKAMIPKDNADELKKIMSFTKDSLTNQSARLPGWTANSQAMGLPSQRDYLERAKNLGSWVNTFNGDGVEYRDHTGRTMHYADGRPVRVMFNDLTEARRRMNSTQYFDGGEAYPAEPAPYIGYSNAR